jgi:hypothetical protein
MYQNLTAAHLDVAVRYSIFERNREISKCFKAVVFVQFLSTAGIYMFTDFKIATIAFLCFAVADVLYLLHTATKRELLVQQNTTDLYA